MVTKLALTGYISMKDLENVPKAQEILKAIAHYQRTLDLHKKDTRIIGIGVQVTPSANFTHTEHDLGITENAAFKDAFYQMLRARIEALNKKLEAL